MNVLDGATRLDPDMNEEAQRWIETSKGRKKTRPPSSDVSPALHANTEHPTPPTSHMANESTLQNADRNTFEESFTAALTNPLIAYDGHFDNNNDYDDETPLLNSYYKASHSPQHTTPQQLPRHAPIETPSKSKPSRGICLWNQVSHNSQYTRPATEILREVLEVRYPVPFIRAGYEPLPGDRESHGLLTGNETGVKRR